MLFTVEQNLRLKYFILALEPMDMFTKYLTPSVKRCLAKKVFIDRESEYNKKEMEFYASQNHDNEEYIVSPSNILQPTYVILPYLNGRTFKNEIEYQLTKNLRTDCSKHELRKMKNLIEMLKGLHTKGLFHRDVSFKNIMSHFVYSPSHSEDENEYFSIIPLKETSGVLKVAYRLIDFGTVKPFPSSTLLE
ncbi:hypothetical protein C9374_004238 [Naegleria lovaniensis]|uniref:Protein kinase domain-containing protein n=1 Tax=Naegleria lovaniensis TaxID=51637 RepID=A0AA88KJT8_NAELO|nr:uncharacterized protein C9374_004238 [Naegleria lovaniensis]KAG2383567.1 hypothetical protein C9374_004238 [Naegleria lovaniensis]